MRNILRFILITLIFPLGLASQVEGTTLMSTDKETCSEELFPSVTAISGQLPDRDYLSISTEVKPKAWQPNSTYALLWSIFPGGGQVYNKKYWKVPIVWGALMTSFYAISWNQRLYSEYHAAYRDLKSENPAQNTSWLAFAPKGTKPEDYAQMSRLMSTLKRGNDYYRRYRDVSIVVGVLLYGLSMLDAYVDAELYTFDISPDLSMRISPVVLPSMPTRLPTEYNLYQVGLACSFTF